LLDALPTSSAVEAPCLGICEGPVVVLMPSDRTAAGTVLAKVRSPKARRDVLRATQSHASLSKRLKSKAVSKKQRLGAMRRLARGALAR